MRFFWERENARYDRRMNAMERYILGHMGDWGRDAEDQAKASIQREARILLRRSRNRPDRVVLPMTDAERKLDFEVARERFPPKVREYCMPDPDTSLFALLTRLVEFQGAFELVLGYIGSECSDLEFRTRDIHTKRGHERYDMPSVEFAIKRFLRAMLFLNDQGLRSPGEARRLPLP